jgi:hypothetical protein
MDRYRSQEEQGPYDRQPGITDDPLEQGDRGQIGDKQEAGIHEEDARQRYRAVLGHVRTKNAHWQAECLRRALGESEIQTAIDSKGACFVEAFGERRIAHQVLSAGGVSRQNLEDHEDEDEASRCQYPGRKVAYAGIERSKRAFPFPTDARVYLGRSGVFHRRVGWRAHDCFQATVRFISVKGAS